MKATSSVQEIHVAQGKAETLAGCLAAAEAKRKVAEENLKRLEIRMGQGRQGLALLKAAKLQTERNAARHQASDISEQMAQLVIYTIHITWRDGLLQVGLAVNAVRGSWQDAD